DLGDRHATDDQLGGDQPAIRPTALDRLFQKLLDRRHLIPARFIGVDAALKDFLRLCLDGQLVEAGQIVLVEVAPAVARPGEDFFFEHLASALAARAGLLAVAAADRAILFEGLVASCSIRLFHTPHSFDLASPLAVLTHHVGCAVALAAGDDPLG